MSEDYKSKEQNYKDLKSFSLNQGASLFGVADIGKIKEDFVDLSLETFQGLNYGVSLAGRLSDAIIEEIKDKPTKLYFYHYRQLNYFLDQLALKITHFIQDKGFFALPVPSSQVIDWEHHQGHLDHRKVAERAGLGWRGKNNLLVSPRFGARIRLVTVLTDFPLKADQEIANRCGNCQDCINVCPAEAIKEKQEDFDHLSCYQKLDQFRRECQIAHYICGVCVKACRERSLT